jgi:glycerate kinase
VSNGARPRPVLVAPDAFKGTLRADEVADAIAAGLRDAGVAADRCPVADGGEGTADALVGALGGRLVTVTADDPLGRAVACRYGLLDGGRTAVVEVAQASGLHRLAPEERDGERAGSAGTGQLVAHALRSGARTVLVAAGGSATTDGGRGAIAAMHAAGVADVELVVLCDVATPFERAAAVFGPQKGADAAAVARLERRLGALADGWPRDPRGVAMSGAAGGLAGGLWAAFGAELRAGAPFVLERLGFDRRLRAARAVVVGEGRLDATTLEGKIAAEVARRAHAAGVPAHAVVGSRAPDGAAEAALGLRTVQEAGTPQALRDAGRRLAARL